MFKLDSTKGEMAAHLRTYRALSPHLWIGRLPIALLFVAIALMALVQSALAHAQIDHCNPTPGTAVSATPAEVRCWFTEEIDSKQSTITVTDSNGARVDNNDGHLDLNDANHKQLVTTLNSLSTGVYKVTWHTVTTDDNGISDGTWYFGVGQVAVPTYAAPAAATVAPTSAITTTVAPSNTVAPSGAITATVAPSNTVATSSAITATVAPSKTVAPSSPVAPLSPITGTVAPLPFPTPPTPTAATSSGIPWVLIAGAAEVIIIIIVFVLLYRPVS